MHSNPPSAGGGSVQFLVRYDTPLPQVTEHPVHEVQKVHPPSVAS